jgi:hypothetical protein
MGVIPCSAVSNKFSISADPNQTAGDLESPSATFSAENFQLYLRVSSGASGQLAILENLNIPLSGGSQVFVNFGSPSSIILLVEDSAEISI